MTNPLSKKWVFSQDKHLHITQTLSQSLSLHPLLAAILSRQGLHSLDAAQAFLSPKLTTLRDPYLMFGMEEAASCFVEHMQQDKRIVVLGDYDVDGVTATSILLQFLKECGHTHVDFFIPNRLEHGYGLTQASAEVLLQKQPDLVITVDNGITAVEEVDFLKSHGVNVIITDHHLAAETVPDCIIVNPNQPRCNYPFKGISGCGVALKLMMAVRQKLRSQGYWSPHLPEPNLKAYFDLAALGTVADVVPLVDENRTIVFHGLQQMNRSPRLAIEVLKQLKKASSITSETLGFQFGPLINAAGRLSDAAVGVDFLLNTHWEEAYEQANFLNETNLERRATEAEMLQVALGQADAQKTKKSIIVRSSQFHEGVSGIVASRLVEQFYRPCLVLAEKDGVYKGSGRSIPDVHLKNALTQCQDLLIRFGGHAAAAGFAIEQAQFSEFVERFEEVIQTQLPQTPQPQLLLEGALSFDEIDETFVDQLMKLAPFGAEHSSPLFQIALPQTPFFILKDKHLKWNIRPGLEMVGWNLAEAFQDASPQHLAVSLGYNEFRGERKIQLVIRDFR